LVAERKTQRIARALKQSWVTYARQSVVS